jgi:hypothetical protein
VQIHLDVVAMPNYAQCQCKTASRHMSNLPEAVRKESNLVAGGGDDMGANSKARRVKTENNRRKPELALPELAVTERPGKCGVLRLIYRSGRRVVGDARLLETTIGPIEVRPQWRGCGYGLAILQDLIKRGGRNTTALYPAERAMLRKAGFVSTDGYHFQWRRKQTPRG